MPKQNLIKSKPHSNYQHLKNVWVIGVQKLNFHHTCFKRGGNMNTDKDDDKMREGILVQCVSECHQSIMGT